MAQQRIAASVFASALITLHACAPTPEPLKSEAVGREIRKTRPCVVVSPDELNAHMGTFIVAPLTTGSHPYPFRISCRFAGKDGHLVLDQLRTVDREHLVKRLGAVTAPTLAKALGALQDMFAA